MSDHATHGEARPDDEGPSREAHAEEVGPLAEEAARLLGSLAGYAREHAAGTGEGADGRTAAAECAVCPLCRTVHAVRGLSPEVRSHLTSAATHLLQAGLVLLAPPSAAAADRPAPRSGSPVEHIDLGEDWPEDREPR